ncbi:MAG: transcriptional regulator [Leptospiraceae bacterium]|nr:transcriptional regulator [Leptospiraceae bacterium]
MKVESFYKHFLLTPVSHIPVVDLQGNILGLLSKSKVSAEMADLALSGIEYEVIPEHFLEYEINEGILYYFQSNRNIPVLSQESKRVELWDKPRFLAEFSRLSDINKERKLEEVSVEEIPEEPNSKMLIYKFMELILRNFPDALFATDKDGHTTFYNEKFETQVLTKSLFKDSITLAEKYFQEVNRDLISEYYKNVEAEDTSVPKTAPILQAYISGIKLFVRVITLKNEDKVIGFLYHFSEPKTKSNTGDYRYFPSLDEAFEMNVQLNDIMNDVEASFIFQTYKKNHDNISHTASALGIPRSTLQNRIKFLGITEILSRDAQIPIPRNRNLPPGSNIELKLEEKISTDKIHKKKEKPKKKPEIRKNLFPNISKKKKKKR